MDRHKSVAWLKALSLIIVLGTGLAAQADDWPQFRGLNRNGVSHEKGWLTAWPEKGLPVLWKQMVGRGYSNVAVAKGKVFTLGNRFKDKEKKNSFEEVVTCLEEVTGKILWQVPLVGKIDGAFPGSRSTPTVDGKVAYVYGQGGALLCLECETGKIVWQKHMIQDLGAQNVTYGYAASPLVVGDLVLIPARILIDNVPKEVMPKPTENALLLAFNKQSGAEVWRTYHVSHHLGGGYYACPTLASLNGKPTLVFHTGNSCLGIEPATGKILWKYNFSDEDLLKKQGRKGITAQEPVVLGNRIVCCIHPDNSNGLGVCLEVNGSEVKEIWRDKLLDHYSCCNILWKNNLFGITHNDTTTKVGPLYCFELETGKKKWEQKDVGGAFTLVDDKFVTFTGDRLILIEASTEEYKEMARSQKLFRPEEDTARYSDRIAPVLANGRIYCRSQSGTLVCLDVSGK